MNKKIIIGIIILILILIISTTYPMIKESSIISAIDKANYCNVDSDCVDAGGKCPFGCGVYVNKDEVNHISKLIESFHSRCIYDCVFCRKIICENNKCKCDY